MAQSAAAAPSIKRPRRQMPRLLALEQWAEAERNQFPLWTPVMLGAGIAGWLVAGAVASRIKRVTGAVREVSPNRLQEVVDLPEGEDEIGRMAAEVNSMLRRLSEAVQSHERFISHVSHELKTPVAALLTEAQVIKIRPVIQLAEHESVGFHCPAARELQPDTLKRPR